MNRRGSLPWQLEFLGKLIIYGMILVLIVYMSLVLIDFFVRGEQDHRAKSALQEVAKRVVTIQENNLLPPEASLILDLPEHYVLLGFGTQDANIRFGGESNTALRYFSLGQTAAPVTIEKPTRSCRGACICAYRLYLVHGEGFTLGFKNLGCEKVKDIEHMYGVQTRPTFSESALKLAAGWAAQPVTRRIPFPSHAISLYTLATNGEYPFVYHATTPTFLTVDNRRTDLWFRFDAGFLPHLTTIDCSDNTPGSKAVQYCQGRPVDVNMEYYGEYTENGERVCYVCQPKYTTECVYYDSKEINPNTGTVIDLCTIKDRRETGEQPSHELAETICDSPDTGVYDTAVCNTLFAGSTTTRAHGWYEDAIGRTCYECVATSDSSNPGTTACVAHPSDKCPGSVQQPTQIRCDSTALHSFYQLECQSADTTQCATAQHAHREARARCPALFTAANHLLPASHDTTELTGFYAPRTNPTDRTCVQCYAERDATNRHMTRCAIIDLPSETCSS